MNSAFFTHSVIIEIQEKRLSMDSAWIQYQNDNNDQFEQIQYNDKLDIFKNFYNRYHEIHNGPKQIVLYEYDDAEYLFEV